MVGDLIGSGEAQERGIVGETPNLAARLQGVAEPNMVVIAEGTRRLLGNLFELEDLGAKDLKGIAGPVRAWAALRAGSVESRFEALHASGLTDLVGREEELELAAAALVEGKERRRPGGAALRRGRHRQVSTDGSAAGTSRHRATYAPALFLLTTAHRQRALSDHQPDGARRRICARRHRASKARQARCRAGSELYPAPGCGALCRNAVAAERRTLSRPRSTPQQRRQTTLEALTAQMEALSQSNPVLMIFEDVHWIDPTSLEALGRAVDRIRTLRVLLIVTYRPEFDPPWIGRPHVTALTINRLAQREIDAMIDRVVGNKLIPIGIRQDIIERTDGIPLFVEEMTKAVLEAVGEEAAERPVAATPSLSVAVPASLHASLMARLDRLGSAKEIAQIGAAIGREFSHALLAAVMRKAEGELETELERLITAGLLFRQGVPPHATYLFKHALVQDAAYGTLLRSSRQQLHGQIASTLEEEFPEIVEVQPELLARHCTEAGLDEQAIKYWRTAGEKAVRRASNREAIGHFRRALALNEKQAPDVGRSLTELAILSQLGPALMSVHGWTAPEVGVAFERAEHLARELESSIDLAPPLAGLWLFHTARGQFSRADEITKELFDVAHTLHDSDVLLQAHHCAWPIRWFRGALTDAKAHTDAGMGLYDEVRHARHRFLYLGHDPAVCALSIKSVLQWLLGHPTQGVRSERDAIDLARRLEHVPSLAHALWFVCQAQVARSDAVAVVNTANELLTLSEEHGLPQTRAVALAYLGWAIGQTEDVSRGIRRLEEGLAMYNRLGVRSNLCLTICLLAETYFMAEQYEKGMEQANLAIATSSEIGDRWCLPRIHMIRARLLQTFRQVDAAEASLQLAVDIAAAQSAKGAQLQAVNSLARLWREQGKPQQARELLAPVYSWFTEGFDTRDLKEAKALLDELHG